VLPGLFGRFFWVLVVACAFVVVGGERAEAEEALASWYGPGFEGRPTASGETYDPYGYTAAHKTLPLGTPLVVSYGGNAVQVIVNDRGPYVGDRELDLSQGAAEAIGLTGAGVDYVDYEVVGGAPAPAAQVSQPASEDLAVAAGEGTTGGTYVVQSGDTLSGISAQLGTSVESLAAINGLANPDLLYVGQSLTY
jgi:rare lipoprotein A